MINFDETASEGKSLLSRREKKQLLEDCMTILGVQETPSLPPEAENYIASNEKMMAAASTINIPARALLAMPEGAVFIDPDGRIIAYNQEALRLFDAEGLSLRGRNALEFWADPEEAQKIMQELTAVERQCGRGFAENVGALLKDCRGQCVPVRASFYFYYDHENRRQGAFVQFLKDVGSQRQHLDRIMFEGCQLLSIEDSVLWLIDDPGQSLQYCEGHVELSRGGIMPEYLNEKLRVNHKIAARFLEKQAPLFITDISDRKWRRFFPHADWAIRHRWKSLLSVPIIINDRFVGVWNLHSKEVRHFDDAELRLADLLGKHMAAELFKTDLSNQNSIYHQIRALYSQLKRTREQLVDTHKKLQLSERRIAEAWYHGKESAKEISTPFEWVNGTVFSDQIKPFKETKAFLEKALTDLRKQMRAETVSLFLTDVKKPFLFKKIVEVDMDIKTSAIDCRFRKSNTKDKTGLKKDEIYHLFNSVCGRRLLEIDAGLLRKLNQKIEDIKLSAEVQALLKNEAFETLGDLALMRDEDFAASFRILPETLEYIKGLLKRYGLTFGMEFFIKDQTGTVRIEKDIQANELFPKRNLERIAEIPSSHRVAHYIAVPLCYAEPSLPTCPKMAGFIRVLNKTHRKRDGFKTRYELSAGFTEDDVSSLRASAAKLSAFMADFYRVETSAKPRNDTDASVLNRYAEYLRQAIETGQPHSKLWEKLAPDRTGKVAKFFGVTF